MFSLDFATLHYKNIRIYIYFLSLLVLILTIGRFMVYVGIDYLYLATKEPLSMWETKFTVVGYVPQTPSQAMSFINAIFKCMMYDYFNVSDSELSFLGPTIAVLSQPTIHIASIPRDTYKLYLNQPLEPLDDLVHLFVDVGSPFRYIYIMFKHGAEYRVEATRPVIYQGSRPDRITIFISFYEHLPPDEKKDHPDAEKLSRDNIIHIVLGMSLEEKNKTLLKKILELSSKKECSIDLYRGIYNI